MPVLAALAFAVTSAAFRPNTSMPKSSEYNKDGCSGGNRSPELSWENAPKGTKSFALVVHDPNAPARGGWYHWVVYNVPAAVHEFPSAVRLPANELGTTSFGERVYGGPCPPPGKVHHYHFTLYALDARIPGEALRAPQLEAALRSHVLARASTIGLFKQ